MCITRITVSEESLIYGPYIRIFGLRIQILNGTQGHSCSGWPKEPKKVGLEGVPSNSIFFTQTA
ncbi:hypothetical protein TSAR_014993 [Trichomalopsis sarcophagae]|uniref:Uncharacterized protein n=1 Tax=Trichomalopsis sarcophagae TaxID=543379 RepID=A0A232EXA4_9HYME|nr:hypothetical protein TSAR_014993 [Trichomalopsis sarcophagae]